MNIENIYRFLASLAVMQEQMMYTKDDLISVHKANLNLYIASSINRSDRKKREKEANENLKLYISSIERLYNSANKILSQIEKEEDGSKMMDTMIETLTESLNQIKIEVKDEKPI